MSIVERVMAKFGPEDHEQLAVIKYCDDHNIPVFHVPNETFTKSMMTKVRNKLLGVRPGVPDLFVLVGGRTIGIEMKSLTGHASAKQKIWALKLTQNGTETRICKGAKVAIMFIEEVRALDQIVQNMPPATRAFIAGPTGHTMRPTHIQPHKSITPRPINDDGLAF